MPSTKAFLTLLACGLSLFVLAAPSFGQDQTPNSPNISSRADGTNALPDVAPGQKALYMITGVKDDFNNEFSTIVTEVHCTNISKDIIDVVYEAYNADASSSYYSGLSIDSGKTVTIGTHGSLLYAGGLEMFVPFAMSQGYMRVIVSEDVDELICTAQVLDALNAHPDFIVDLPMYKIQNNKVVVVPMF